jgi:bifunctional non-homologous end joining protein LigD
MNQTLTAPPAERVTLYYREGSSDKVYQAAIEPQGEKFVVKFAFGRRGSTLNTGTKTQTPVDYDTAKKIFTTLVNEKKAKGYTEGPDGTPYQHTEKEDRVAGVLPQLLNPIEEAELNRLIQDRDHYAQEKYDGRRMLVRKNGAEIHPLRSA